MSHVKTGTLLKLQLELCGLKIWGVERFRKDRAIQCACHCQLKRSQGQPASRGEEGALRSLEEEESPGAVVLGHHAGKAEAAARVVEGVFAGLTGAAGEDVAVQEACVVRIDSCLQMFLPELPAIHVMSLVPGISPS